MIILNQIYIIEPVFVIIFYYTYQRAASKQESIFLEAITQIYGNSKLLALELELPALDIFITLENNRGIKKVTRKQSVMIIFILKI